MTKLMARILEPSQAIGWALLALLCMLANAMAAEPALRFAPPQKGHNLVVCVTGLSAADVDQLQGLSSTALSKILSIRVDGAESSMLGVYEIQKDGIRFESRFPGSPGRTYRADFYPSRLPMPGAARPIATTVIVPSPSMAATTELLKIYPTRDRLPENQLKFYLHFSASMSRGDAYSHIRLIDEKGKAVANPFLELGEELWDADAKRFTLFLHPGRIKRGLKMRDELGPILEEGKRYTLVIDARWPDAEGNPLRKEFRKSFSVAKPDDIQPDPRAWTLKPPTAGQTDPVIVDFQEPLDHALLARVVWIEDSTGKRVDGRVEISNEETRWQLRPKKPWVGGNYKLVAETILEDLAGNSISRPFEVDIVQPIPQPLRGKTVSRTFEIK